MDKLKDNVLYTLDKCFRTYHRYAQQQVTKAGYDITIDQWLLLKHISEYPGITQNELGNIVAKDNASVARIIQNLVKSGYLERAVHASDRRRVILSLTTPGKKVTEEVNVLAIKNRSTALGGVTAAEIVRLRDILNKILNNCNDR